jgi:hypothetical protein
MKKNDILKRAVKLADKSKVRAANVVVAHPKQIKTVPEILSHRLYTRITPSEAKRLDKRIGTMVPISALLRDLLLQYLDKKDHEHKR